ncbi:hypothetical protein [Sporanaerobacter acetigenes]|uniref:Uncharacterized protein n=1 Tax=Sporanaerobacter acetigenes DSM 13106 TaxID=1123281 RepID=A0A1M5RYY8_9FIRM|nr:hypothetical protein [Sporanaerobacter acetigenes]SHH31567.1 hypothetical protein SAMN02745180_00025 [Sporanaerobacter acetigenes DSM 13106]
MNLDYIKQKEFKDWYKKLDGVGLCLTDDLDSLASCKVLNEIFKIDIYGFFSFDTYYLSENRTDEKLVGVDLDLAKHKAFSNHVTYIQNPEIISLNKGITRANYYDKFAGSTLITVLSLYNVNLDKLSNKQLQLLLAVDSGYLQYHFNKDLFTYYYKDVLQYPQFIDIAKNTSKKEFERLQRIYNLKCKIQIDEEGYLNTYIKLNELGDIFNIDLSLPKEQFISIQQYQNVGFNYFQLQKENITDNIIFSSAITNKDYVKLSLRV